MQWIRWSTADWLASTGKGEDFERALKIDPGNEALLASTAIFRSDNGDPSPVVDEELRRAASMNPEDSGVLMALGLRKEFQGKDAEAEIYLTHAAEIDHQFKPSWTLANYYYRANQPDKFWAMIERCLKLDPFGFDPTPVFDLAWNETGDSGKILSVIPKAGSLPIQYLNYLINTRRVDAAAEAWPVAFAAARNLSPTDRAGLTGFPDFLEQNDHVPEATKAWNQMVDGGVITSGRLDPETGKSIADPDFRFPLLDRVFGWRVARDAGVSPAISSGALRFELDGNEPESVRLLYTIAPVVPGRQYRLVWKSDGTNLSSPVDAGFAFRIVQRPGDKATECPLLTSGPGTMCEFGALSASHEVRIELNYTRALGTTRAQGVLRISSVRLEFAS